MMQNMPKISYLLINAAKEHKGSHNQETVQLTIT